MICKPKTKHRVPATLAAVLLALSAAASAGTIVDSPHDFTGYHWSESGEICSPCHTPHQTRSMPLPPWNRQLQTDTYSLYTPIEFPEMAETEGHRPNNSSKMCLSCHDGTVAPETFGDVSGGSGCLQQDPFSGGAAGGDHPVSFLYDTSLALADGDLYDPSRKISGVADSTGTISDDMLFEGMMECSSCHDVHNTRAVPETKLLLKDDAGSGLCLTCHDK